MHHFMLTDGRLDIWKIVVFILSGYVLGNDTIIYVLVSVCCVK